MSCRWCTSRDGVSAPELSLSLARPPPASNRSACAEQEEHHNWCEWRTPMLVWDRLACIRSTHAARQAWDGLGQYKRRWQSVARSPQHLRVNRQHRFSCGFLSRRRAGPSSSLLLGSVIPAAREPPGASAAASSRRRAADQLRHLTALFIQVDARRQVSSDSFLLMHITATNRSHGSLCVNYSSAHLDHVSTPGVVRVRRCSPYKSSPDSGKHAQG